MRRLDTSLKIRRQAYHNGTPFVSLKRWDEWCDEWEQIRIDKGDIPYLIKVLQEVLDEGTTI